MTGKEYLNQAYLLDQRIDSKLEQLISLRELVTRTTSIMGGEVVKRTRNTGTMQDVIAKMVDLENEMNADVDRLIDLKTEITNVINAVQSPEYRTLLELRYLGYKSWKEIARLMHYTESNVYKLHLKALRAIKLPDQLKGS